MSKRKYFGTDGIRGAVGQAPMTPDFMLKLGWAIGKVLGETGREVVIGKDTRASGYMFESALASGLTAAGLNVLFTGPLPTPAIAYATKRREALLGIVISASHNPYTDNGIKIFRHDGTKLSDAVELEIESVIDNLESINIDSEQVGKMSRYPEAATHYIDFSRACLAPSEFLSSLKVVVDCAHGATYQVAQEIFKDYFADVTFIGITPDGCNINKNCGSTHIGPLQAEVKAQGADIGLAFDGDGDRIIVVDEKGLVLDGDALLYVLAKYRLQTGLPINGVVGTSMTNLGLELALEAEGIPLKRTKVGDKYVLQGLQETGWRLGGESSGHVISLDHSSTGDGILTAVQLLVAISAAQKPLSQLTAGMQKLPQIMINVPAAHKDQIQTNPQVQDAVNKAEQTLGTQGRVLLRPSGTEPVVRVMVEGEDENQIEQVAKEIADVCRVVL